MVSSALQGITFSLRFAGQDPKGVETRAPLDAVEWDIDALQVFVFDKDGKFIEKKKVNKTTDGAQGQGKFFVTGTEAIYTYPLHNDLSDYNKVNTIRQFFS